MQSEKDPVDPLLDYRSAALTIVSGATALALIVFTVPLTTLVPSAAALNANPAIQAWILSAMPLGAAAGLLGAGALGDNNSRRQVFLWGVTIMLAASALGAVAPNGVTLVLARVVQGLGSAAVLACGLGLIGRLYQEDRARAKAAGIWAAALGAGVAIGPLFAALLSMVGGWRAAYIGTGLLAAILLISAYQVLPPDSESEHHGTFDWLGALLLLCGLAALLAGLTESRLGWQHASPWVLIALGVLLLLVFLWVEWRQQHPVLDLSLFRYPDFVSATVAAFASGAGVLALMTLVPTFLQRAMHIGALVASLVLMAWSVTSVFSALVSHRLLHRFSPACCLTGGLLLCAVAQLMLVAPDTGSSLWMVVPALVLAGIANGVLNSALGKQAVASVPQHKTAMGSGANNTARYLGSAIGITVGAMLIAHGEELDANAGVQWGWHMAIFVTASFSFVGACVVAWTHRKHAEIQSV